MSVPAKIFSGILRAGVPAALLSLCPLSAVPAVAEDEGAVSESAARLAEKVEDWEAALDAIYAPDPFDPEIPFLPEKTPNPEIAAKRDAFKTKLRTVSKFKKKVRPEEIDLWFAEISPTLSEPLELSINAELREEIAEKLKIYNRVPAREVFEHPSARFFPGAVPEKFRRVGKPFYPDPEKDGWQSTGLYAAPGERVKVRVSKSATSKGVRLRIGAHTDNLLESRQRYWRRFPCVSREFAVREQSFEIASPFGGLIYVRAPRGSVTGRTQFVFSGVVEAPFFVLGETKKAQWDYVRYAPAPWAEFVGKNFAATFPADEAAAIDDPEAVIAFWDRVVADVDKLVSGPEERFDPMRFVVDAETTRAAAGHAGDPIVGNLLWSRSYWDLERIRRDGAWELFFAIGKNSLSDKWVFSDDRDTPAALIALFCMEKATGRKAASFFDVPALQAACFARIERDETREKNKKAMREQLKQEELERKAERRKIIRDAATGKGRREREKEADEADVQDFRHDPGVPFQRLSAYLPVVEATGWEPLERMFRLYTVRNRLPLANADEKRRTFVMLWSQTTKKNLSPFFEHFGFPPQNGAGNYPDFMPENFPPADAKLRPGNGGTGYRGASLFPTIAVLNGNYRVPQIPKPDEDGAGTLSPFGTARESAADADKEETEKTSDSADGGNGAEDSDANGDAPEKKSSWEPVFE